MRAAVALAALLPAAALADISISFPSGDSNGYWVANHSNTIQWSASSSDPNVTVIVRNDQNATLNGDYDIAEYVNVASLTYTVTNVTLLPGTGYQVLFVNTSNTTQEYTRSDTFEIKPNGTTPATVSAAPSGSSTSGASHSGSGSQSGSAASSTSTDENGARANLALPLGPLGVVAGLMAASAALFL
ncbi:DRMIP-like protein [Schizophyllum fasciatum]